MSDVGMGGGTIRTLRRKQDFDRLFRGGSKYRSDLLTTVVRFRSDGHPPRAAFIVGARVDKRAVVRNRVKRRLREAWRREMSSVRDGIDVGFIAHAHAARASFHELAAALCKHLHEAGAIYAECRRPREQHGAPS